MFIKRNELMTYTYMIKGYNRTQEWLWSFELETNSEGWTHSHGHFNFKHWEKEDINPEGTLPFTADPKEGIKNE